MAVARNVHFNPKLCPGGGATEMEVAVKIYVKAKSIEGIEQWPYKAIGEAIEVIPRTLVQNCGENAIRTLTALRVSPLTLQSFDIGASFSHTPIG